MTAQLSVYDPLQTVDLLTDPAAVEFIATQMNDTTLNGNRAQGALPCKDLSDAITDIVIQTAAQGASILEVHISDPWLVLITRYGERPAFVDVDDAGLLIPVDVNFPDNTEFWWRLQAAEISLAGEDNSANLVLTFEDRIVVQLRDLGGPVTSGNNQTRAQFIAQLVAQVPDITLVCPALRQKAGAVGGDLTPDQLNQLLNVKSAQQPNAPAARRNPSKSAGISRTDKHSGATWTKNGWRYSKPIDGMSPRELSILNPPTNRPDTVRNS